MKKQAVFIYEISTCNRRKLDGSRLSKYFLKNNYKITQNPEEANLIILVTCAYSTTHAEHSLQLTKKFLQYDAELIVTGCLPDIETTKLQQIFDGKTISTKDLQKIDELFPQNKVKFSEIQDANVLWVNTTENSAVSTLKGIFGKSGTVSKVQQTIDRYLEKNLLLDESLDSHDYILNYLTARHIKEKWDPNLNLHENAYYIKSSEGCLGNCSYCVIKNAIGPLRSKSLDAVMAEFQNGLNRNYKNFIFDADDTGAYGVDLGSNLPELLDKVTNVPGDYAIYLRNIHPIWVVKYVNQLEALLQKHNIRGISCSIQSGNERILKLMQRFSDTEQMKEVFSQLRTVAPDMLLSTECINGFPTETREEFKETLEFIKEADFTLGYIYPFSSRPGSIADQLAPKVDYGEITFRMKDAKKFLEKYGYKNSFLKYHKILFFSKASPLGKLDEGTKSFFVSTID